MHCNYSPVFTIALHYYTLQLLRVFTITLHYYALQLLTSIHYNPTLLYTATTHPYCLNQLTLIGASLHRVTTMKVLVGQRFPSSTSAIVLSAWQTFPHTGILLSILSYAIRTRLQYRLLPIYMIVIIIVASSSTNEAQSYDRKMYFW